MHVFGTTLEELRKQQELFDTDISRWIDDYRSRGGRIYCDRGCRNCCSLAVHATFPEALLVAELVTMAMAGALEKHVARLTESLTEDTDLKTYLRLHRRTVGSCPFLDEDGACGVYRHRPFSCRSLLSTRPGDWCGLDPLSLDPCDRELYLKSLDPMIVFFPTHYAAGPQEQGLELENAAAVRMRKLCGFTLSGNLTVLVHLERTFRLSAKLARGYDATKALLARSRLDHPLLLNLCS
jgi:Fe-S-cluster containining protein